MTRANMNRKKTGWIYVGAKRYSTVNHLMLPVLERTLDWKAEILIFSGLDNWNGIPNGSKLKWLPARQGT